MMKIMRALAACLLLLSAGSALAQKEKSVPPEAVDQDLGEIVNVNVVNLDVYVNDKSGKRIQGLTKDDFEIYENGKKMGITNFYPRRRQGKMIAKSQSGGRGTAKPGRQSAPRRGGPALRLVVYIELQPSPLHRNRSCAMRAFLGRSEPRRPGDVVTYDREPHYGGLHSDPGLINDALSTGRSRPSRPRRLGAPGSAQKRGRRSHAEA